MRLATIRLAGATRAVRLDPDGAVDLGFGDVGALLEHPEWRTYTASATGSRYQLTDLSYAPVVVNPAKIVCVGLNYRSHILEMGRPIPQHPTLFAKYTPALIGAHDDIVLPAASDAMDWEAELGLVIGCPVRHATRGEASAAIAGFTVVNDVTARDWQNRTPQWLQGKTFEATTPVGPWLVTDNADNVHQLRCTVDGEVVQEASTADLVFDPVGLVSYVSTFVTLQPGDLIATGTPGGVGHARQPPRYLADGSVVVTTIDGIGECRNACRAEDRAVLAPSLAGPFARTEPSEG